MSCGLFCFQCLLGTNMSRVWTWLCGKRGLPFCKATSWTLPTWVAGHWISIMCWTFRTVSSRLRSSLPTLALTARCCPATGSYPVSTAGMEVVGNKWWRDHLRPMKVLELQFSSWVSKCADVHWHSNFPMGVEIADACEIALSVCVSSAQIHPWVPGSTQKCVCLGLWKGLLNLEAKWFILNKDKNPCDFTNRFPVHSSVQLSLHHPRFCLVFIEEKGKNKCIITQKYCSLILWWLGEI